MIAERIQKNGHCISIIILRLLLLSITIDAQELGGWIDVISTPSSIGAQIIIDKQPLAKVPAKLNLSVGEHNVSINRQYHEPYDTTVVVKENDVITIAADLRKNAKNIRLSTADNAEIWIDGIYVGKGNYSGIITYGRHIIESKLTRCKPAICDIVITADTKEHITIGDPSPIYGSLQVTTSIPAVVWIDEKRVGESPLYLDGTIGIGEHSIEVFAPNHFVEKSSVIIKEGENTVLNVVLREIVDVTITTKPKRAQLSIDDEIVGTTPYSSALEKGEYDITLYARNHLPFKQTITVNQDNRDFTFKLKRQFFKPSSFYLSGEYQCIETGGARGCIGGYINNINIEANLSLGLKESEVIFWNVPDEMTDPVGYSYLPMYVGGSLGYGFIIGNRLRITPQAGTGLLLLKGHIVKQGDKDPGATDGYCIPAKLCARVDLAIAPSVALTLTPLYSLPIYSSDLYKQLSGASDMIKGFASGIALGAGISIIF